MFFPYKDDNPRILFPFVTYGIIAVNVVIFLGQFLISGRDPQMGAALVFTFGFVPAEFNPLTIFTSMFMHGGFMHLLGNMLFLWVLGDNVEDSMGHKRFVVFYLLSGLAAVMAHALTDLDQIGREFGLAMMGSAQLIADSVAMMARLSFDDNRR